MDKKLSNLFNLDENNPYIIDYIKKYVEQRESFKFIRMTDDIQSMSSYLNDIRICFIAITVTIYVVLICLFIVFCVRRNRRNVNGGNTRRPRSQWDYPTENQNPGQTDDLVSVRSDGQAGLSSGITATPAVPSYMGRNHHRPPTFMRHGLQMNHAQQTTRLVADNNDGTVKHQLTTANTTSSSATNPTNNNIGFSLQNLPSKHSELNGNGITGSGDENSGRSMDRTITSGGGGISAKHKEAISEEHHV